MLWIADYLQVEDGTFKIDRRDKHPHRLLGSTESLREFDKRGGTQWSDYLGKLFRGRCFRRGGGIQTTFGFQLIKQTDQYPEIITAPWLVAHSVTVSKAYWEWDKLRDGFGLEEVYDREERAKRIREAKARWLLATRPNKEKTDVT